MLIEDSTSWDFLLQTVLADRHLSQLSTVFLLRPVSLETR
jgi:hypothetical protein